jgi:hypothetical protein
MAACVATYDADEQLARSIAAVMPIGLDRARAAVCELQAARRRQRAIAATLARYPRHRLARVRSEDGGAGDESCDSFTVPLKLCGRCWAELPVVQFSVRSMAPDGRSLYCRSCTREYRQERRGQPLRAAPRPRISPGTAAVVRELRAAGLSYAAVAKKTGVSTGSAWRLARQP